MGSPAIQFLSQFPVPISHYYFADDNCTSGGARRLLCLSSGRSGGSRWDTNPKRRSRFSDAYETDEFDEEDGFAFAKQRMWWSDDGYAEDDEGFGILEASIGFKWVSKVFRAFGWMIPAVVISLVMGTGPNGIIMAIALPLAQSALSLAADTLWGRPDERPRRAKSKKRPFGGGQNCARMRKEKDFRARTRKEAGDYKSWFEGNIIEGKKAKTDGRDYGGWDELDYQVRMEEKARMRLVEEESEAGEQERVKISRRAKGDTPLFMRLLIAMFPYLGFWAKLF